MNNSIYNLVLLSCCFVFTQTGAAQSILHINPKQDNTLYEDASGSLSNGKGAHMFVGRTNGGTERRAVVAFELKDLPVGAVIEQVRLSLHMSRSIAANDTVDLFKLTHPWGEGESDAGGEEGAGAASVRGDATWIHSHYDSSLWAMPGGDYMTQPSVSVVVSDTGYYQWEGTTTLLEDLQSWLDNPDSNHGWILVSRSTTGPSAKRFDTREHVNIAFRPTLTVSYSLVSSVANSGTLPLDFNLAQNYPNPFNPSTEIQYELPRTSGPVQVKLNILNLLGQTVRTLVDEIQSGGRYSVTWDSRNDTGDLLPGGTYFYRLAAGDFQSVRRMTLVK